MSRRAGFSLVELVVVMVIAAIITAVAIPLFNDSQIQASWYHEQVKSAVRYAQRQAVAQRRCVFVQTTAAQLSLFYGDASCAITVTPLTFLVTSQPGKSPGDAYVLDAPAGTTLTASTFSFNGLGRPSSAVSLTVGGSAITVEAETGYVQ